MGRHDRPEVFLESLRLKFMGDELPSEQDLKALMGLCSHPARSIRETALTLLLHPPVGDELSYFRQLICFLTGSGVKVKQYPLPLLEVLCEFVAVRQKVPEEPEMESFFIRVLKNLPNTFVPALFRKSFPLKPFVRHLSLKSLVISPVNTAFSLKRRWGLLRKRLMKIPGTPSWAQLTFADLGCLFQGKLVRKDPAVPAGRWLVSGRPLVLSRFKRNISPPGLVPHHRYWRGMSIASLRYFNRLLDWQVEELRSVKELAQTISQNTRRVVLSWHNATLAASSGWAFEKPCQLFPSESSRKIFGDAVQSRIRSMKHAQNYDAVTVAYLCELWEKRIALPKILHLLREDRTLATIEAAYGAESEKHVKAAGKLFDPRDLSSHLVHGGYGWAALVSPHQRTDLNGISAWLKRHRRGWHGGLLQLAALLQEGQLLLEKGSLSHLVLPWIDKFFISSRREADWEYLATLVQWFERHDTKPLILFWEDTPHPQDPSLKLTLRRLREQGRPYQGIGVFGWEGSSRAEALKVICDKHREAVLFALRPYNDCHNFRPFHQLLEKCEYGFFQNYDSSWKDGLCFLYAGTQIFPLLSVQSDMENVAAWIMAEGVKYPFGSYFRGKLREAVLGKSHSKCDALSRQYALWANLC